MKATATRTIVVTGVLSVSVSIPSKSYTGVSVTMSASWDGIAVGPFQGSITWGDGTSENFSTGSKSISRNHTYTTSGSYTVKVSISDETTASGGTGQSSITIGSILSASLSASPVSGDIPLAVTFTIGFSGGFSPYSWFLTYGDGGSGSGTATGTITHTYTKVGTYTATLTVTDALGASIVARSPIRVGVLAIPSWVIGAGLPIAFGLVTLWRLK